MLFGKNANHFSVVLLYYNHPEFSPERGGAMRTHTFEDVWRQLQRELHPQTEVRNWTVLKGYLGDSMKIVAVRAETIEVDAPRARNLVVVPKAHFKAVWEIWNLYTDGLVPRAELTKMTFFSKYIISVLHWLEMEDA
jgi:hypothetical protein